MKRTQETISKFYSLVRIKWLVMFLVTLWVAISAFTHISSIEDKYFWSEIVIWSAAWFGINFFIEIAFRFAAKQQTALQKSNKELERQSARQEALLRLSTELATMLKKEVVCEKVIHALHEVLGYEMLGIFFLDEATGERVLCGSMGWPNVPPDFRLPAGKGISERAILEGKLHYTPDVSLESEYFGGYKGSEVDLPLRAQDRTYGLLVVERAEPNAFDSNDLDVLDVVAHLTSIALDDAYQIDKINRLAITDSLTGIYNRHQLFEMGRREVHRSQRYHYPFSIIMLDIDHFKKVNDTYGHRIGDQVLAGLAERVSSLVRAIDIFARYGGEEFVLLLPDTRLSIAVKTAERLHMKILNSPIQTDAGPISITASLGVTELTDSTPSLTDLIDSADKNMYTAKSEGRNRIVAR
ncbi:MAG: sensor domain-containing diguanylate cyclase [Anaerolineales bacterium]|nr:sensor domain-containing diguanylate cyclase [Anaerolineales bacterium]